MLNRPGSVTGGDEVAGGPAVWAEAIPAPKRISVRPATIAFLRVFFHVEGRTGAQPRASAGLYITHASQVTAFVVSTAVEQKPRRPSDLDEAETTAAQIWARRQPKFALIQVRMAAHSGERWM